MTVRPGLAAMLVLAASPAALFAVAAPPSAHAADPAEGRRIAERWCTTCHVVGEGPRGTDAAPPLDGIAADRGRSADWVRGWLADPHPPMPTLDLTRAEIDDVVAYLESLEP